MTGINKNFFVGSDKNSEVTINGYLIVSDNFEYIDSKERFKIKPETFFDTKGKFFFYFSPIPLNVFNYYSPIDVDAKESRIVKILVKIKDIVDTDSGSALFKTSKIFVQNELSVSELMEEQKNFSKYAGLSFLDKNLDGDGNIPNSMFFVGNNVGDNFEQLPDEYKTGNDRFKVITETTDFEFNVLKESDYFYCHNISYGEDFVVKVPFPLQSNQKKAHIDFISYGYYNKINILTPENNIFLMSSYSKLSIIESKNTVYSVGEKNKINVSEHSNLICSYGNNATINIDGTDNNAVVYGNNSNINLNGYKTSVSVIDNNNVINVYENNQSCIVCGKNTNIFVYSYDFSFSGVNGTVLHFAKFDSNMNIIEFSEHVVGDGTLKENTFYEFKDGEIN